MVQLFALTCLFLCASSSAFALSFASAQSQSPVPCPNPTDTISQSRVADLVFPGNSTICLNLGSQGNGRSSHYSTSIWRSFEIEAEHTLTGVEFGVEQSRPENNSSQSVAVNVYLNPTGGAPAQGSNLTLMRSTEAEIRSGAEFFVCAGIRPLKVDVGDWVVVEVHAPEEQGNLFVIGSNSLGESAPGYISYGPQLSPAVRSCGPMMMPTTPTDLSTLGMGYVNVLVKLLSGDLSGTITDVDGDGIPDDCDVDFATGSDCNSNGEIDDCEIAADASLDCDIDGNLDDCQVSRDPSTDLNSNGVLDRCERTSFLRADTNADGTIDIADAITMLDTLFIAPETPMLCKDAWDTNDDGLVDIADIVILLLVSTGGASGLNSSVTGVCDYDTTDDTIGCQQYDGC